MTDQIAVETAIRQFHALYADAVWPRDYDAFGDCFTEDAEWRIAGMVLRGRPHLCDGAERLRQWPARLLDRHLLRALHSPE